MWFKQYNTYQILTVLIFVLYNGSEAISNANFNEHIRDYSVINDNINLTDVKTLQKANIRLGQYSSYAPFHKTVLLKALLSKTLLWPIAGIALLGAAAALVSNPVLLQLGVVSGRKKRHIANLDLDVPDNLLSGSSHGRGLLHHDHGGYGQLEYEEPHYGYEYQHDFNQNDPHYHQYGFHDYHHQPGHHVGGYGHHHKHYDQHALLSKTLLWPIAGIALLGAAAALVSNPVLLQLGVVSGRKKRHIANLDLVHDSIKKWSPKPTTDDVELQSLPSFVVKRRFVQKGDLKVKPTEEPKYKLEHKSNFKILKVLSRRYTNEDEEKMVPIPLIYRQP